MVNAINEAMAKGMSQKTACSVFMISPRKFRRWAKPKTSAPRTAWNKLLPAERETIRETAWQAEFLGKPLSHLYVYGHESGKFLTSLSTLYRVLEKEPLAPKTRKQRSTSYIGAHTLLDTGFSLLCYDATRFVTETDIAVWALPVMILPCRYLLHIGHALHSVSAKDLINSLDEAYLSIPESVLSVLMTHSDRGTPMKAKITKEHLRHRLNLPVHFGRPHTPDDEGWIEALIKNLKYHREVPSYFSQVDDVIQWLRRFPNIYNHEPHSALGYVTPHQALLGRKEEIISQRKQNLAEASARRLAYYRTLKAPKVVITPLT